MTTKVISQTNTEQGLQPRNNQPGYVQVGMSRPPLEVQDLPTPEEVFKVKRIGLEELALFVLGPSLIALGISVGSGEWMLGPLNVGQYGFRGIGWVILVSALLQVFYNVELGRFTLATGEVPVVAFGRTPPGYLFWVPFALFCFYLAFILGGWTVSAGSSLFSLFTGRPYLPSELETVRIMGIALLVVSFLFISFGRKIERTMELVQGVFLAYVFIGLILVTLVVVPFSYWSQAVASLVIPAPPPAGTDPSLLGALAGFTALASGLNFMVINYYRDKGYGMGSKVGFISGLFGGKVAPIAPVGKIFPEDLKNTVTWRRWFGFLLIDQWGIYFIGCLIGILAPSILVGYLSSLPGAVKPDSATVLVYAGTQLGLKYGPLLFSWALLTGFVILFTTQIVILELLARNFTDALMANNRSIRRWSGDDARKVYYPAVIIIIVIISILIHLALPTQLIITSANLSNFAALIFPLVMIYLNRQLPRPARLAWWSYLVLIANVLFFGFFFVNFLVVQMTGAPWINF